METSYEKFFSKECNVSDIAEWKFLEFLKIIKRRLTFRQKFTNPWSIILTESIHRSIFVPVYQAIRDHIVHRAISMKVERNRIGEGEKFHIEFKHVEELIFHLSKICKITKDEVRSFFYKQGTNERKAKVIVSEEKPFSLAFDAKKSRITIK